MNNNKGFGKTLTVFIVLIFILLASCSAIGFFLYNKEKQMRHSLENDLEVSHANEAKLQGDLKEIQRQLDILAAKNKEADNKINDLLADIDLKEEVNKQIQAENKNLKDSLELTKRDKERARQDMNDTSVQLKKYQDQLQQEQGRSQELQERIKELEKVKSDIESKLSEAQALKPINQSPAAPQSGETPSVGMDLDKIVVNPQGGVSGKVLSVDQETEFVVCNLGLKQGVKFGDMLSVYRGQEYLGDVKVSRVQEEMSAADIVPPFSSRKVRKNDVVVLK